MCMRVTCSLWKTSNFAFSVVVVLYLGASCCMQSFFQSIVIRASYSLLLVDQIKTVSCAHC